MRLVVGVVDRPSGSDAVAVAERCARSSGFELHLCTVVSPAPAGARDDDVELAYSARDARAHDALRETCERVAGDIVREVHLVHDDSPARGLMIMAEHLSATAIVVGGPTTGDVNCTLLHASPFAVILAPHASAQRGVERLGSMTCAVGPRSGDDLVQAAALAAQFADTPLRLMTLLAPAETSAGARPREEHRDAAYRRLAEAAGLAQASLPVDFPVSSVLVEGTSIADAAARLDWSPADMVLLGSSRLARPRRTFISSTAAMMMRVLPVPVSVIPRDPSAFTSPEGVAMRQLNEWGQPTPTTR